MLTDPYEAELLLVTQLVDGDKKPEEIDSDSNDSNKIKCGNKTYKIVVRDNDSDDPPVMLGNDSNVSFIAQSSVCL